MSLARFTTLLGKLPAVPHIHLQGVGEPLLNRALPNMIRLTRQRNMRVGTSTNGSLLTTKMCGKLLDAGINRVNLSLDTLNPEEFTRVRPGAPVGKVISGMKTLSQMRSQGNYQDCELAIAVVAEQSTIHDLPRVVALAADLGFDEVYVQNLNGSFLPAGYVTSQQCAQDGLGAYRSAVQDAEMEADRLGIHFLAPSLGQPNPDWRCGWPFHGCNITWDGFVSPCCLQPDPDVLNFGNLFDKDFPDIWFSPAYEAFRQEVRDDRAEICRSCPDLRGQMWHPKAAPL